MNKFSIHAGKFASVLSLTGLSSVVLAGGPPVGSITYSGLNSVPMLGGAGLVVLSALLALVSVKFLKNRENGGQFLVLALIVGAMASGGSGIKLISDAYAGPASEIVLGNSSGGTVNIPNQGLHAVRNNSGVTQKINQINTIPGCFVASGPIRAAANGGANGGNGGDFKGGCDDSPSTVLRNDEYCFVEVCCGGNGGANGGNNGGCFILD
jgi:hypothetical protein